MKSDKYVEAQAQFQKSISISYLLIFHVYKLIL